MADPISIQDFEATADDLILYLSGPLDSTEAANWENPDNYELQRTRSGSAGDSPEATFSYDDTDPSHPKVVIHLASPNLAGDTLYLKYIKAGEESNPIDFEFDEPSPEPSDMEWIKGKLETIDEGVDDIQGRLPLLEDAAQIIKDEIPDDFNVLIGNIADKVTGIETSVGNLDKKMDTMGTLIGNLDGKIDERVQQLLTEIGKILTAIGDLQAQLTPIGNIEAKLEPIVTIDENVKTLTQAAQVVAQEFPKYDGYIRAQFKTITDAVVVPPNTPLKQIEAQLLGEQKYVQGLAESPDKQWKADLVARQFNFWKGIVPFIKKAQQAKPSQSMELLQADVNVNLSDSAGKEQLIDILASPELKRDALKRINKALVLVNS